MCTMQRLSAAIQESCYYFIRSRELIRRLLNIFHIPRYGFPASSIPIIARKSASLSGVPVMQADMIT
jgi:hypothetical protein